ATSLLSEVSTKALTKPGAIAKFRMCLPVLTSQTWNSRGALPLGPNSARGHRAIVTKNLPSLENSPGALVHSRVSRFSNFVCSSPDMGFQNVGQRLGKPIAKVPPPGENDTAAGINPV